MSSHYSDWIEDDLIRSERTKIETSLAIGHLKRREKYDNEDNEE